MGLHSTITRTPLLDEKPVTKWRRRTLADPILSEMTADSGKTVRVFSRRSLFRTVFATKAAVLRRSPQPVWTPHPSTEFWANLSL